MSISFLKPRFANVGLYWMLSENVLLCFMYFLSHGTLDLIASTPGPFILTLDRKIRHISQCNIYCKIIKQQNLLKFRHCLPLFS